MSKQLYNKAYWISSAIVVKDLFNARHQTFESFQKRCTGTLKTELFRIWTRWCHSEVFRKQNTEILSAEMRTVELLWSLIVY